MSDSLGISDVERGGLFELVVIVPVLLDNFHDFFSTDGDLTAHGVLRRDDVLTKTVEHGLVVSTSDAPVDQGASLSGRDKSSVEHSLLFKLEIIKTQSSQDKLLKISY